MERITSSRAYRITYIGVPLVVAGLVVQERDHGFRHLRNDYVPSFRFRYDDYLQYAENRRSPGAQFVGPDAGVGCLFRRSDGRSGQFSEIYLPYAPSRRIEQQVVPVGAYGYGFYGGYDAS